MLNRWWFPLLAFFLAMALAEGLSRDVAFGLLVALGVVLWVRLQRRLEQLQSQLDGLMAELALRPRSRADAGTQAPTPVAAAPANAQQTTPPGPPPAGVQAAEPGPESAAPTPARAAPAPPQTDGAWQEADERSAAVTSSLGASLKAWVTGGNTIVRAAVLILFIGVAFLVRYAAEHALLPIELRLAGAVVGGLALVVAGWRLRGQRRGYALTLQGGGVGIVYLVLFAGFRLYGLIPSGLAFALLVALGAATVLLALRQDALPLAALAFAGGFLAPVLTSTGQGSHVALFGFYLLLNLCIAWIATRRPWKLLNTMGFLFTFGIGLAWGVDHYTPALLASTEPFLLAHLVLYLAITVQYSRRLLALQDARLPLVDGGLLFGVPLAAFGAQAALVQHLPYALGASAAVLAALYLLLARWLWRQAGPALRVLTEGLLALGVVFLALVAPLTLDARWTAAAWALQGAGVLWVALRQRRAVALALGLVLQLLAGLSYWGQALWTTPAHWLFNAELLSALLLAAAALFSALRLHRGVPADAPAAAGRWSAMMRPGALSLLHWVLLASGTLHALAGISQALSDAPWALPDAPAMARLTVLALALSYEATQRRLAWPGLAVAARVLLGSALVVGTLTVVTGMAQSAGGWPAWRDGGVAEALLLAAGALWLLRRVDRDQSRPDGTRPVEHGLLFGWGLAAAASLAYALGSAFITRHEAWTPALLLAAPLALMGWLLAQQRAGRWPAARHPGTLRLALAWPLLGLGALWSVVVNLFTDGGMAPLPHVPLLNPVDLAHGLLLLYGLRLWRQGDRPEGVDRLAVPLAAGLGFWWLNAVAVRVLHHWAGTPMWLDGALDAGLVQTALSLLWTLCALAAMALGSRRALRPAWMAGAALLGAVVVKLMLVDLSHTGALMRIVSFIGVGLLMLLIGYLAPLPPARTTPASKEAA